MIKNIIPVSSISHILQFLDNPLNTYVSVKLVLISERTVSTSYKLPTIHGHKRNNKGKLNGIYD